MTSGWATNTTSADAELGSSLTSLRNRSRALVRDAAYAKRARVVVQNNVIGAGIAMQAQVSTARGTFRETVNDAIEAAWCEWSLAKNCHTGGTLHFNDLERALMGQVFEAGEVFVRKHYRPFGNSQIPFALEMIEAERIADNYLSTPALPAIAPGAVMKMGIEVDQYDRPLAYWVRTRHPGESHYRMGETDKMERVPADQMIHLRLVDRWPQTRGEPWLHAVARKLNDMDGYSEAEILAARGAASIVFTVETPDSHSPLGGTEVAGGDVGNELAVEAGMGIRLNPGEEWKTHAPNRPNTALDPFMRYMLREISAGTGPSYEAISRDYSQSNFSSSQIAVQEDRDLWRIIQQWFIRTFRKTLHAEWLQAAVFSRTITAIGVEEYANDPVKFEAVNFKPRGWGWVRPREDVPAMIEAHKAGFLPLGDIIAMTCNGKDFWDVMKQIQHEREIMDELGLVFTTSPEVYVAEERPPPSVAPPEEGEEETDDSTEDPAPSRVFSLRGNK